MHAWKIDVTFEGTFRLHCSDSVLAGKIQIEILKEIFG